MSSAATTDLLELAQLAVTVAAAALLCRRAWRERRWWWAALAFTALAWVPLLLLVDDDGLLPAPLVPLAVAAAVSAIAAVLGCCFSRGGPRRRVVVADAAVLGLAGVLTMWVLVEPRSGGRVAEGVVVLAADLTLLGVVAMSYWHQPWRRSLLLLGSVLALSGASRWLFALEGVAFDASNLFAALVGISAGALLCGFAVVVDPEHREPPRRSRRSPVHVAVLVAVAMFGVELLRSGAIPGPTAWVAAAFGLAVAIDQAVLYREERRMLAELEASEERFRATVLSAPIGIVLADRAGIVRLANPAVTEMLGWPSELIEGMPGDTFLDAEQREVRARLTAELLAGTRNRFTQELWIPHAEGGGRWIRTTVSALRPALDESATMAVLEDVTDRHEAQARLERQRDHDGLTGLLNRSGLMAAIDDALGRPGDADPAVVVIDLDLFAAVNDALGHDAGDRLLLEIAQRLARTAGIEGSVARLAGDQFGVLLTPRDADRRVELVDSLADAVRVEVELRAGEPTYPTASVGVAVARPGWSPKDLTRAAELAMREAKAAGRNRIHWSASDGAELPPATHQLVGELHRALEAGEFVVEFQPIVELPSGRTVGSEALVRWHHPDRGLLPPAAFLPVAEAAGLVGAVGRTVLEEACRRTATWNREIGPMDVSVNAAVAQLSDPCFVDLVQQAITASGLAPERLWIEITESAFISDVGTVSASLRSLRDLGVHLSVDDFGTGYSSLTYLRRFPVESIKVDREFVAGLGADPKDEAIVASVLDLGARLGLRVVAEGVELDRQVQWLRSARCRLAQGYRLGRPMPARALEERLLAESAQPAAGEPAKLSGSPGTG